MNRMRRHIRAGNVLPVVTLFAALAGTSVAAVALPKNSVTAKQVKRNAVGASEIRENAVRTGEVKNGTLRAHDFRAGQLPVGPTGPQGERGPDGWLNNARATVQRELAATALADGTKQAYEVFCPDGQQAIAGAARGDANDSEFTDIVSSHPLRAGGASPADGEGFTGWRAVVVNPLGGVPPGGDINPDVWVVCVPAPAP